jgi:hypothetical protein
MRTSTTFSLLGYDLVSDGVMLTSCGNEWKGKHKDFIVPWPVPFNGETVLVAIVLTTFKGHHKGQPKGQGGLGVTDTKLMNVALMAKWIWRCFSGQNEELLWLKLFRAKYRVSDLFSSPNPVGCSPFWHSIHKIKNLFRLGVKFHPGTDSKISFWNDLWVGEVPLRVRFPALFQKSYDSDLSIAQAYSEEGWRIPFRRSLDQNDLQAWRELCNVVEEIDLANGPDRISWHLDPAGNFST